MTEIKNAVIESATITAGDHGILTAWLDLDYGGSGQGFGGFCLYLPKSFRNREPLAPNVCGHFLWRVMEVAGVGTWDELIGKTIRVKASHARVEAIGHIVEDKWFDPGKEFAEIDKLCNV